MTIDTPSLPALRAALERITLIPAAHRAFDTPAAEATTMLRCSPEALRELAAAGLPSDTATGEQRFCRYDVFNLALYSGSGATLPELGFEFAFRFTRNRPDTWVAAKPWRLVLSMDCPDGRCAGARTWTLSRPVPELFGGDSGRWSSPDGPVTLTGSAIRLPSRDAPARVEGEVTTAGIEGRIASAPLRGLFDDFLNGGLRWQLLPASWQRDPDDVLAHGVVNCIAASLYLERRARELGHPARGRRGWLVGLMDLDHAWLEVQDDDGATKPVDVVLALLTRLLSGDRERFVDFCMGSSLNRVLPAVGRAEAPLAVHTCDAATRPARLASAIRSNRAPQPSR